MHANATVLRPYWRRGAHAGVLHNVKEIMGASPDEWWWPPLAPRAGGTWFPTVYDDVRPLGYKM